MASARNSPKPCTGKCASSQLKKEAAAGWGATQSQGPAAAGAAVFGRMARLGMSCCVAPSGCAGADAAPLALFYGGVTDVLEDGAGAKGAGADGQGLAVFHSDVVCLDYRRLARVTLEGRDVVVAVEV